ncbi:MAG: hypothetical protein UET83_00045 [Eubacteriales bacterium]|nr:hypothetical protein [Eubacteriales bacterium]
MHDSQSQIPPLDKYNQYTMKTGGLQNRETGKCGFFGDFSANEVCVSTAFMVYLRQYRTIEAAAPCAGSGRAAAALYGNFALLFNYAVLPIYLTESEGFSFVL